MKKIKKALSILLAAVMIFGTVATEIGNMDFGNLGIKAEAAGYTQGYYTYDIDEDGKAIIGYVDPSISGAVTIPSTLGGCPVATIFPEAFEGCNNITDITIPDSVKLIGDGTFSYCTNLTNVIIPNSVIYMGSFVFSDCYNLKNVSLPDSITIIPSYTFASCYSLTDVTIPDSVTSIGKNAFYSDFLLEYVHIPSSVTTIGDNAIMSDEEKLSLLVEMKTELENAATEEEIQELELAGVTEENIEKWEASNATYICSDTQYCQAKEYANTNGIEFKLCDGHPTETPDVPVTPSENIYNLGEETYSFSNFGDGDSVGGHCFGMSMTSSAYYTGELDISTVGGSAEKNLYNLTLNNLVKKPICKYQDIQGSYSVNATVAGGSYYKTRTYNINSDWNEVINYVKNHEHDNKGALQIGYRKEGEGGHAINFLRYEEVNGQQRIYAYDNNFPDTETYFYKNSNGKIQQAPYSTFSGSIDCIALRSVSKYFDVVDNFDSTRYIYADRNAISINGVNAYPIDGEVEMGERVIFEVPANVEQVTITPLIDNAEFEYLDEGYSFGSVNDDTVGVFKLALSSENIGKPETDFTIINGGASTSTDIRTPSTTTISYGDSIILHADIESFPSGGYVEWTASNGNFDFDVSSDGLTCKITPAKSGDTTFTATIYDANGNAVGEDTQEMTSKAGFFRKIIVFFKKLFGLTKTYENVFKDII